MKATKIEEVNNQTEITVETGKWKFIKVSTYRTNGRIAGEFYNWLKLPENTIVADKMSFQLDVWKKIGS